ncbi:unnamed protein product [Pylaiella littoralis]
MPEASKAAYTEEQAAREGYGGSCYTPLGKEPAYQEGEKQHVESFSCTRPLDETSCNHLPRGPELHKSLFPDSQVPGFGAAHSSLWEALRGRVALPMMAALEEMLCLPRDFLLLKSVETSSLNMSLLRTLRYPAREGRHPSPTTQAGNGRKLRRSARNRAPSAPIDVGISEHTDFEVFTIMHQESAGLYLCAPSGGYPPRWYQLPFRHDTLTVILGDMMELWTSGWLEATRHKVVSPAPGEEARRSLVLFQAHDDLVRVHPLQAAQLAARKSDSESGAAQVTDTPGDRKHRRRGEQREEQSIPPLDSFVEWVRHRPKTSRKKFRPTTQGAWVRKQEFRAKAALERPV